MKSRVRDFKDKLRGLTRDQTIDILVALYAAGKIRQKDLNKIK